MKVILSLGAAIAALPRVWSWGAAGHEIVATIAQIHLHPTVRSRLCEILPPQAKCHLAPVASWADQVKGHYRATAPMHYVNPKLDHPADHCEFGQHGWINEDVNVLTAIMNETARVMAGEGDIPLRFLIHFMGDMHQPLHLTGRDKGGNGAMFLFEGRHRNLHSVWDGGLITKKIRELGNYTSPLPSKQIESNLLGAIFDPYVRWIVWEGLRQWWTSEITSWLVCPTSGDPYPHSSLDPSIPQSSPSFMYTLKGVTSFFLRLLPSPMSAALTLSYPLPLKETDEFPAALLSNHPINRQVSTAADSNRDTPVVPACPFTWATPIHQLNCDVIWPKDYTGNHGDPLIELDTPEYVGRLDDLKTVEKLLAMAGIRLASVINTILGETEEEKGLYLVY